MDDRWLAGVDGCPGRLDRGLRPRRRRATSRAYRAALCRRAGGAGGARRRRGRHSDRPAGARRPRRAGGRELRCGRFSARGSPRCSRCRRAPRSTAADYREACRIALATFEPPRKVSKQLFMLAPKIREVDACLRADAGARGTRVRGPSRGRVLAAQRRSRARRAEEGQGPLLRAGACAAAAAADRCRLCRPTSSTPRRRRAPAADDLLDALACAAIARRIQPGWRGRFPIRPRATRSACRWRSGRERRSARRAQARPDEHPGTGLGARSRARSPRTLHSR